MKLYFLHIGAVLALIVGAAIFFLALAVVMLGLAIAGKLQFAGRRPEVIEWEP